MADAPDNKTITWGERAQKAAEAVYEQMLKDGIPAERKNEMNVSAVVLYALQQTARFPRRKGKVARK